jgi:hypothetical protein
MTMFGLAWMFWLVPLLLFCMVARRWRREPWGYALHGPSPRAERELDEHREYVDSLERRVAELEERLDFTERLLAQRNQAAPGTV